MVDVREQFQVCASQEHVREARLKLSVRAYVRPCSFFSPFHRFHRFFFIFEDDLNAPLPYRLVAAFSSLGKKESRIRYEREMGNRTRMFYFYHQIFQKSKKGGD